MFLPFIIPAITSVIKSLTNNDSEKDPDDIPDDEPNFKDVELTVKFPLIRLEFPPAKLEPEVESEEELDLHSTTIQSGSTTLTSVSTTTYRSMPKSIAEASEEEVPEPVVPLPQPSPPKGDYGYVNTQLTFWTSDGQYNVKSPAVFPQQQEHAKEPCSESISTSVWPETEDERLKDPNRKNNNKEIEYDEYGLPITDTDRSDLQEPGLSLDDLRNGAHVNDHNSDISNHESLESQSFESKHR